MAKTRLVNTKIWTDSFIQELSIQDKLLFIYFITNPHTELCGVYEISMKTIEFETGIDYDSLSKAMHRLSEKGKVFYRDGYLILKNFAKHQQNNPKIQAGVKRSLKEIYLSNNKLEWLKRDDNDRLYIDYDSLSHSNLNLNLNSNSKVISKDIKEQVPKTPKDPAKKSYGNEDINKLLEFLKEQLGLTDFKETQKVQRQYGQHLVNLAKKIGKDEFVVRLTELAKDSFHLKNLGSLKYMYNNIKGFVTVKKDNNILIID